ncbi:hypothetical protein BA190_26885 [Labrys sp. WJW]|uniref:hypothetical protein n=1 Tax=Labrys sp. WJW TaxID=1737983 RepID=UPI00082D59B4|nr:hypothetical protein [Labrys sp. WJW]OCC01841.1 hypothetical protein BA190_26885 [Labrys sp. WJW]
MADSPVTAITDIMIANNALAVFAGGAIMAFDEDTDLAAKVNATYVDTIESCLAAHPWTFALKTASLQQLTADPQNDYRYAFQLPGDRIGLPIAILPSLRGRDRLRDFAIEGDRLCADRAPLWAGYRCRPAVTAWPAAFRQFATRALAAALAMPVSQDANLAAALDQDAWGAASQDRRGGLFLKAMQQDLSHPGPQPLWASDPLTDAWYGGASSGEWWA